MSVHAKLRRLEEKWALKRVQGDDDRNDSTKITAVPGRARDDGGPLKAAGALQKAFQAPAEVVGLPQVHEHGEHVQLGPRQFARREAGIEAVAGSVERAARRAAAAGIKHIIVEVDDIAQIEPALAGGATHLLLDNMDVPALRACVALVAGRVPTEASGGVRLDTIAAIAASGVDYVSVGRLTQSAPAADIGLDHVAQNVAR